MSDFIPVGQLSDFPTSNRLCAEVEDRFVVVVRVNDNFYCVDDVCTHDGGTLGDGDLEDYCLVCPRHGAKFDVRDGSAVTMPATEPTGAHEVRIEGDQILVKLAAES